MTVPNALNEMKSKGFGFKTALKPEDYYQILKKKLVYSIIIENR